MGDTSRHAEVELPSDEVGPLRRIGTRVLVAIGLIVLVAMVTYIGRDGYFDPEDDSISLLDAFYYSTVSITTTGYGDVRPVSDEARLITTVVVTPARILFLILLVGTTLEILAERGRTAIRQARWRRRLKDHIIICGFGVKGREAAKAVIAGGRKPSDIVVIENRASERGKATEMGLAAIAGSAAEADVLRHAKVEDASTVIVTISPDDSAVLATLTARELAPHATIVSAVREEENAHLLHQGGANTVITSSSAAGRLLGLSVDAPAAIEVLEDLLTAGEGLDIVETEIGQGQAAGRTPVGPLIAIRRGDRLIRFNEPEADDLQPGDRVVELKSHPPD